MEGRIPIAPQNLPSLGTGIITPVSIVGYFSIRNLIYSKVHKKKTPFYRQLFAHQHRQTENVSQKFAV